MLLMSYNNKNDNVSYNKYNLVIYNVQCFITTALVLLSVIRQNTLYQYKLLQYLDLKADFLWSEKEGCKLFINFHQCCKYL